MKALDSVLGARTTDLRRVLRRAPGRVWAAPVRDCLSSVIRHSLARSALSCSLLCALAAGPAPAEPILPLPPVTYVGRIVDAQNRNITALTEEAVVTARKADGSLMDRAPVTDIGQTVCNYRLIVPMATRSTPTRAAAGERIEVSVEALGQTFTAADGITVDPADEPGTLVRKDLVLSRDSNRDGVPDSYANMVEAMAAATPGYEDIGPYDPKKDYDRDGRSNYEEYLAGTNPLDATDRFAITALVPDEKEPGAMRLTFVSASSRSYQLSAAGSPEGPWKERIGFKVKPDAAPVKIMNTDRTAARVEQTILIPRDGAAELSRYFRIHIH